ncbi:probable F-box protein At4g22030 [Macadamia integrifolia]|uniref:probable F-box protein At4g22030 n=1 Tax=Macadamia integrifolia TaxID=60698 RepID=UPI001C528A16|nr:probable F-box protein At4g22030 [Macadamia integrifolia]
MQQGTRDHHPHPNPIPQQESSNMVTLQTSSFSRSSPSSSSHLGREIGATLQAPKLRPSRLTLPRIPERDLVEELNLRSGYNNTTIALRPLTVESKPSDTTRDFDVLKSNSKVVAELYAVMEAAADRAEMHTNIGEQRSNWNHLLLTSINAITLTAATMVGLAATTWGTGAPLLALKLSSTLLYSAATGMLVVMNKIQPSQLAEEQRNAARLFKQLQREIQTTLAIGTPTKRYVKDAMDKVLALDRAYPLPLLGTMLEKFPATVEPAVWWPQQPPQNELGGGNREKKGSNGWNAKLEEEMRQIVGVLKRKDTEEYLRLSKLFLKVKKALAISGPLLTGLAAVGSALVGSASQHQAPWAIFLGVAAGALAAIVNTMEHGWQVGMVFEMYRSNAGFFQLIEESIGSTLKEREVEKRKNGELFEMNVALQLGRSLSELRDLAASSSSSNRYGETTGEFASKLF